MADYRLVTRTLWDAETRGSKPLTRVSSIASAGVEEMWLENEEAENKVLSILDELNIKYQLSTREVSERFNLGEFLK